MHMTFSFRKNPVVGFYVISGQLFSGRVKNFSENEVVIVSQIGINHKEDVYDQVDDTRTIDSAEEINLDADKIVAWKYVTVSELYKFKVIDEADIKPNAKINYYDSDGYCRGTGEPKY